MSYAPEDWNPLALFELAGEKKGWSVADIPDIEEMKAMLPEGSYGQFVVCFEWEEEYDFANLRFHFLAPQEMPEWALLGIYNLVNLMNQNTSMGRWFYDDGDADVGSLNRISWQYEIPTSLLGDDGDETMVEILENIVRTHD